MSMKMTTRPAANVKSNGFRYEFSTGNAFGPGRLPERHEGGRVVLGV
jgi:hypothetical protein